MDKNISAPSSVHGLDILFFFLLHRLIMIFSVPVWIRVMIRGTHLHMDKIISIPSSMYGFDICFASWNL